jgi:hypothetical protein
MFHKMLGSSEAAAQFASQEGFSAMMMMVIMITDYGTQRRSIFSSLLASSLCSQIVRIMLFP